MNKGKVIFIVAMFVLGLTFSTGLAADLKDFKFGEILAMSGSGVLVRRDHGKGHRYRRG